MQLFPLGWIFLAATGIAVASRRPDRMAFVIALSVPWLNSVALSFGDGNTLPAFSITALGAGVFLIVPTKVRRMYRHYSRVAKRCIILFFIASSIGGIFLPIVFEGVPVLLPNEGIDNQVFNPGSLELSLTNFAQIGHLLLGLLVVLFFMRYQINYLVVANVAFGTFVLLNIAELMLANYFSISLRDMLGLLEAESFTSKAGDIIRFPGIYGEPSYLAVISLPAAIFFLVQAFTAHELRQRFLSFCFMGGSAALVWQSASGTALLSIILCAVVGTLAFSWSVLRSKKVPVAIVLVFLSALVVFAFWLSNIVSYFVVIFSDKLDSSSFEVRNLSNEFSFKLFIETWGLGVGLGSSRPSSFFFMLISNLGLVGTAAFVAVLISCMRNALSDLRTRALAWSLVGLLIAKVVAEPNMSLPLLWFLIAACAGGLVDREYSNVLAPASSLQSRADLAPLPCADIR